MMLFKGAFKDSSFIIQLLMFSVILSGGLIASSLVGSALIIFRFGISPETILYIQQNILDYPDLLRNMQFFQIIGLFIFPAIICGWLFSDDYKKYLQVNTPVDPSIMALAFISVLIAIPFINWTCFINQQLVLPEWMKGLENWMIQMEEANGKALAKMLYADTAWIFLYNIIIICVLTGIGEEFIFRGVVQKLIGKIAINHHVVIWVTAIIFSAIHLQFYGFIARMLLGAYFGYLLFYTKSMWIPAIAHFSNNFFSVTINYIFQDSSETLEEIESVGVGTNSGLAISSFVLFIILFMLIKRKAVSQNFSS